MKSKPPGWCAYCSCDACVAQQDRQKFKTLAIKQRDEERRQAQREHDDRTAAIWLLLLSTTLTRAAIARLLGVSPVVIGGAERLLSSNVNKTNRIARNSHAPNKSIARLVRANAIPAPGSCVDGFAADYAVLDANLPPDNWPIGTTKRKP